MRLRSLPVLIAVGLTVAACGSNGPDRFSLRTPGANTGEATVLPESTPSPSPTPTATPKAKLPGGSVTSAEKRVIRGWSTALRHGHVAKASRYFSLPSVFQNNTQGGALATRSDVEAFNRDLPCGAKLVKATRGVKAHWVVGTFVLTDRPGGSCGTGTGDKAYVAFMISRRHITEWIRVTQAEASPTPAPTPTPTPSSPRPVTELATT